MADYREAITEILQEEGVEYWESGKNVSKNTVNVRCPFCSDHSNHCGIFVESRAFNCWLCGRSGGFATLLSALTGKSEYECKVLIRSRTGRTETEALREKVRHYHAPQDRDVLERIDLKREVEWPEDARKIKEDFKYPFLDEWLAKRKYTYKTLRKYGCRICLNGYWAGRLVIPILIQEEVKGFIGADITGEKEVKYKMSDKKCKEYIYGFDNLEEGGTIILVEGTLDKWRTGKDCAAIFGTNVMDEQRYLVLSKRPKEIIISLDGDAYWKAKYKIAPLFRGHVDRLRVVKYPFKHDPDSYGKKYGRERLLELIHSAPRVD